MNKKKVLIPISFFIVVIAIITAIFIPKLKNGLNNISLQKFLAQDIKNIDNIELIADCSTVDSKSNTVAGVKESIRLGADAVIVDLCFRNDFTPVMSDDYSVVETSPTVESLFKAMNEDAYKKYKIYLNIVQLSDLSVLNQLAVDYQMLDRLYLIGIDSSHYGMITTDNTIIPFYINYDVTGDDIKNSRNGTFTPPSEISECGASGIIISQSKITAELVDFLDSYGIPFIVNNIGNDGEFCSPIADGSRKIIVHKIDRSREIINLWIQTMQERYNSSVEKSLEELSEK